LKFITQKISNQSLVPGVLEDIKLQLLINQILYDVTFILDNNSTKLRAHKCILAARSEVFRAIFSSNNNEELLNEITIPDISGPIFQELLNFIYIGTANIFVDNALNLMICSEQYGVQELSNNCAKFIGTKLNINIVCSVLAVADKYQAWELVISCKCFIRDNAENVFNENEYFNLSHDHFISILEDSELVINSEYSIFEAVVKYAENQAKKTTKNNARSILTL